MVYWGWIINLVIVMWWELFGLMPPQQMWYVISVRILSKAEFWRVEAAPRASTPHVLISGCSHNVWDHGTANLA